MTQKRKTLMSNVQGVIEAKSKKGTGIMIAGQWYNGSFETLSAANKGDSVQFALVPGYNGKQEVSQLVVTAKGAPKPSYGGGGGGFKKKPYVDNSIGMAIGMGMNNAVQLCIAEKKKFDAAYIEEKAIEIYKIAEKLKKQAQALADSSAPAAAAPAPQPVAQVVPTASVPAPTPQVPASDNPFL
jgi:hypothetical protein